MTTGNSTTRIIGVIIFYVIANVTALVPLLTACDVGCAHGQLACCHDHSHADPCDGDDAQLPSAGMPRGADGPVNTCPDPCHCPLCPCHHGSAGRLLVVADAREAITPIDPHLSKMVALATDLYCPFLADIATPPPKA